MPTHIWGIIWALCSALVLTSELKLRGNWQSLAKLGTRIYLFRNSNFGSSQHWLQGCCVRAPPFLSFILWDILRSRSTAAANERQVCSGWPMRGEVLCLVLTAPCHQDSRLIPVRNNKLGNWIKFAEQWSPGPVCCVMLTLGSVTVRR